MKYKEGDRVRIKSIDWYNEKKDEYGNIPCGEWDFMSYMSEFCGKILTIDVVFEDETYLMKEDNDGFVFTNEMIEGLVEEETKPKYEDEVNGEYYSTPKYLVRPSGYQFVDENGNVINARKIVLEKLVVPKFKKGDKIKDKNNRVWYVVQVGNRHFDISCIPNGVGYFVPIEDQDDYELFLDKEYPKTYEECCEILGCCSYNVGFDRCETSYEEILHNKILTFRKLYICRDAYWKLYGGEIGLGKPWEPNWETLDKKYNIYNYRGVISHNDFTVVDRCVLVFPTAEMRDAFYEYFKKEIEICKELL